MLPSLGDKWMMMAQQSNIHTSYMHTIVAKATYIAELAVNFGFMMHMPYMLLTSPTSTTIILLSAL